MTIHPHAVKFQCSEWLAYRRRPYTADLRQATRKGHCSVCGGWTAVPRFARIRSERTFEAEFNFHCHSTSIKHQRQGAPLKGSLGGKNRSHVFGIQLYWAPHKQHYQISARRIAVRPRAVRLVVIKTDSDREFWTFPSQNTYLTQGAERARLSSRGRQSLAFAVSPGTRQWEGPRGHKKFTLTLDRDLQTTLW